MKERNKALVLLHFIVFLWGFTGILGKELNFSVTVLVFLRMMVALISIALYKFFWKKSFVVSRFDLIKLLFVGVLTAAHWLCFFYSIHISNISTALAVISTTAFFVAVISPLFTRKKFVWKELALGALVTAGVAVIFNVEMEYAWGIVFALLAALFAAIFSSFNGRFIRTIHASNIAFYEMLGGSMVLIAVISIQGEWSIIGKLGAYDWLLVVLLGTVATAFAFIASVNVMKHLSPFSCAIAINLEPVYTIVLALLLYGQSEYMRPLFYVGAVLILSSVWLESLLRKKAPTKPSGR
jgi:drug/metabolite transporter (DMT)-like permease